LTAAALPQAQAQAPVAVPDPACRPSQASATVAAATARACDVTVEVIEERSETADVFVNPDGSRTAKIYSGPVRMRDASGGFVPVDLTLRFAADGSIAPVAHPGALRLSGPVSAGTHELLSINAGGSRVALDWVGALPAPVLTGNRATYREVRPGVDLVVEATRGGVEQTLVVKTRAAAVHVASVRLPIRAKGLRLDNDGAGGTVFRDAQGAIVATSPTPEMWDSSVDPVSGRPERLSVVPSTRTGVGADAAELWLTPSRTFLDDPATLYPVTVDPSINPVYDTFDTTVKEGDTVDRSGSDVMSLGWAHGASPGVARSFVHWPATPLKGTKVTSATVNFWNYFSATCSPRQWQVWSTGPANTGTRWTNQPAWLHLESTSDQTRGFDTTCSDNWISASATTFFDRAAAAQQDTAYMGLRSAFEGQDVTYWKDLRTNRSDNADHIPYASVTYNSYPNALPTSTLEPADAAELGTTTPAMRGVFSDPDGGTGRVDFEIYNDTGATLVTSGSGSTVASGATSTWTVPSGRLTANATYKWRARGHDGSLGGPWSGWRFMTTSDGSPTGAQARFSFQEEDLTDRLNLKVNVANGNLMLSHTDLQIRGTGIDLVLDRYYNSRSTHVSTLGKGWTLGTAQDVNLSYSGSDHATASITYRAPTGFTARFANTGANAWRTPPSIDAVLTRNTSTGELRLKFDRSEGSFYFADSSGRLLRIVDKNNNKVTFGYDASGQVTTITDTQGRVVTLAYASGRLASMTDSTGRRVSFTYDGGQNLQTVTDAAGDVTRYEYTGDRLTRITTPGGRTTQIGYEPATSRMVDFYERANPGGTPSAARYVFTYLAGRTEVTDPNGAATTDPNDGKTTHTYEARDRVTKVRDPLGHERSKSYTANDNVQVMTDALNNTITIGWDPNTNNMTSITMADGARSTLTYGNATHPHSVTGKTDSQGNVMGYSYDVAGNKTATTSDQYPGQEIEDLRYNTNGTVDYKLDGKDIKTDFTYDAKGNLTFVDNPAPLGDITVVPDALSRMADQTDGKGQRAQYIYDKLDRIDRITFHGGSVVDFTYDKDGNLTAVSDPTGTTTLAYDGFGRNTSKTSPGTGQVRYEYDRNGNLTKFSDAGGDVVYAYNQANLLASLKEPGASNPVTFTYDENNRRRFMYLPTSPRVTVEMRYDRSGRQTLVEARNDATAARLSSFSYSYTRNGADTSLRQSMTDLSGTTTYSYDRLNRITGATGPGLTRSYAYDVNSNRTSKTENGATTSYTYNNADMLTSAGPTTYSYDGNGNLTSSSSGWALSYNAINNQTTTITRPGGSALSPLRYAGQDQTERVKASTTTFVHTALGVSSASTASGASAESGVGPDSVYPASGTSAFYTRDNSGNLIGLRTGGARYYFLVDGLGSVVGLVNGSATKVNSYSYDPYGKQLSATQQVANPWRYAAGFFDGSTGLTKFGARYYDPDLGRFTQRDPSGRDLPYAYAGCDPVNNTDPTGLDVIGCIASILVAIGATILFGVAVFSGPGAVPLWAIIGAGFVALGADLFVFKECFL
jgi:RHS repeat-associated protein